MMLDRIGVIVSICSIIINLICCICKKESDEYIRDEFIKRYEKGQIK